LNRHGLSAAQDEAALLVSELVTNAIRHANSDATIAIDLTEERVRVSVTDYGPGWPEPHEPDDRPGGYGLQFVAELADNWGTYRIGDGKTVWFELHVE
jgi:signal transduction histidine kinase